jgi:methyltransferase (TIGR00027 family)
MLDQTASRTALGTAFIRAAHQIFDAPPLLFPDPMALPILGPDAAATIAAFKDRHQSRFGRGLRSHVCLRARFAEDKLAAAAGTKWYVLVGAGFDTFALRQQAPHLRIIEVDHPATQAAKRDAIAAARLAVPDNLTFAPADFTRETLGDVLGRQAIGRDEAVYFSWLGVSMYLEESAVDDCLRAMAGAADRVGVCLTFKQPSDPANPWESDMAAFVANLGEKFISVFTPDEMAEKLARHGFAHHEFLTADSAREAYYMPPRADLPAPRHTTIVYATS